jgi:dienelactone hydrolase
VSAPHLLPLQEGQAVPMRAWWRHWNIGTEDDASSADEQQQSAGAAADNGQPPAAAASPPKADADEALPAPLAQQLQRQPSLLQGEARQQEISSMMAAGWEAVVLHDWAASLRHLTSVWQAGAAAAAAADNAAAPCEEFDGVLGFSNGAAAAFLFAAHAAAHPEHFGSLRFVALAGGYVPEPLERLLSQQLLAASSGSSSSSSGGSSSTARRLRAPLPFPSLHMMGQNDPLIEVDVSTQLMECFQEQGR